MHTWATSAWLMLHLGLQPAAPTFERAAVVVDASAFHESDASLEPFLEDVLGAKLWTLGIGPRRDADDPVLWLRVRPADQGYAYTMRVGPSPDAPERKRGACSPCTREQLSARLEGVIADAAVDARHPPAAASVAEPPRPPAPVVEVPTKPPPRTESTPLPQDLGPLQRRRAGIATLVSGVGVAACGAILVGAGDIPVSPNYATEYTSVEYGKVGYGVLAAGLTAAVVGGILLGVEAHRARRSNARAALRFSGFRF